MTTRRGSAGERGAGGVGEAAHSGDARDGEAGGADWRPTAGLPALRLRAEMASRVRSFFADRAVLEVETPVLGAASTPEPHLESLVARRPTGPADVPPLFLQTSPELHMKRLLAAGSGPIYQLARVFRGGERGRRHNLEFTLLEWYRPGWDLHALMDEVEALVRAVLAPPAGETEEAEPAPAARFTYSELFREHLGLDPLTAGEDELDAATRAAGLEAPPFDAGDRDGRLDLLLTHVVEPRLPLGPVFVHGYPPSQASLARLGRRQDGRPVAERFEFYLDGVELANGFDELTDAAEQRRRFQADREHRRRHGLPPVPLDERFLAALEAGMPAGSGVALGFDRLVLHAAASLGAAHLDDVLAFPADRA